MGGNQLQLSLKYEVPWLQESGFIAPELLSPGLGRGKAQGKLEASQRRETEIEGLSHQGR